MSEKVYALYFDANGCGPAPLSLAFHTFPALSESLGDHLGIQFKAEGMTVIASPANAGLYMSKDDAVRLRDSLNSWLEGK